MGRWTLSAETERDAPCSPAHSVESYGIDTVFLSFFRDQFRVEGKYMFMRDGTPRNESLTPGGGLHCIRVTRPSSREHRDRCHGDVSRRAVTRAQSYEAAFWTKFKGIGPFRRNVDHRHLNRYSGTDISTFRVRPAGTTGVDVSCSSAFETAPNCVLAWSWGKTR